MAKTETSKPLSFMRALNSTVACFEPEPSRKWCRISVYSRCPSLIIVFTWAGAKDAHIAQYIQRHRAIFYSSRILLVRCSRLQLRSRYLRARVLKPALQVLQELVADNEEDQTQKMTIMTHVFSSGGATTSATLWGLFIDILGSKSLPRHVTIMDSSPVSSDRGLSHRALNLWMTSRRLLFTHLAKLIPWPMPVPSRMIYPSGNNATVMNTIPFQEAEMRRTYIYGKHEVINWEHSGICAAEAEKLKIDVRMEEFEAGEHITAAASDGHRYWKIVMETWGGGVDFKFA